MMEGTKNDNVHDLQAVKLWSDKDIVHIYFKKNVSPTKERLEEMFDKLKGVFGIKKACFLIDISDISPPNKEARDYAEKETRKMFEAAAVITKSHLSRMIANIFISLNKPPYPMRLFNDEENAKSWLYAYKKRIHE